jgi:hypothetical protein
MHSSGVNHSDGGSVATEITYAVDTVEVRTFAFFDTDRGAFTQHSPETKAR